MTDYTFQPHEQDTSLTITDSVKLYLTEIGQSSLLSPTQEQELAIKAMQGDKNAKNILIECNLRLVISIAKRYSGRGMAMQDLIQEGNLGLIKAVDNLNKLNRYILYTCFCC